MTSEIQKLSDRHQAMMRDKVLFGFTSGQIAEKYSMSINGVSVITNSPLWKKQASEMHDNAVSEYKGKLMNMVPKAIVVMEDIMEETHKITTVDKEGNERFAHVANPPASRLKASEMVFKTVGLIGDKDHGGGSKSVVLNMLQPAWDAKDGKAGIINIEVS